MSEKSPGKPRLSCFVSLRPATVTWTWSLAHLAQTRMIRPRHEEKDVRIIGARGAAKTRFLKRKESRDSPITTASPRLPSRRHAYT